QLGIVALADEPAVVIGEGDDDGLDGALGHERTKRFAGQHSSGPPVRTTRTALRNTAGLSMSVQRSLVVISCGGAAGRAVQAGPGNRRRSPRPYHTPSAAVSARTALPARMSSGTLNTVVRKITQRIAMVLMAVPNRPRCHGPRAISRGVPRT